MQGDDMTVKVYVLVSAVFDADGTLIPISLTWEDGTVYAIDRVLDIHQVPALKAGRAGRHDRKIVEKQTV